MAEESCSAEVVVVPKFDMQCYESKMTAKDVILLAQKYIVPLDFHPSAPTEGWMMNQLPPEVIGLYEQFFEFSGLSLGISPTVSLFRVFYKISKQGHWFSFEKRVGKNVGDQRAVPDAMAWRHHDSDVYDAFPDSDFSRQDIGTLTERIIDLRPVPHGLVFAVGLATTWDFPGFFPIFKDTGGNVVTISKYLRFPFLSGTSIEKGVEIPPNRLVGQHTTLLLSADQHIPDKTNSQVEVEC
ncbi:hypothetical protein Tco_0848474 [Tanacetum coccineum]